MVQWLSKRKTCPLCNDKNMNLITLYCNECRYPAIGLELSGLPSRDLEEKIKKYEVVICKFCKDLGKDETDKKIKEDNDDF